MLQQVTLEITTVGSEGQGIGRLNGMAVFVPGALPGETVKVELVTRKKSYLEAQLVEVLEPSPQRVIPKCPYFGMCGGCQLQHIDYAGECSVKEESVVSAVRRIGKQQTPVRPILFAESFWRYRNRANFHLQKVRNHFLVGFYAEGSHQVVDLKDCLLLPEGFCDIAHGIAEDLAAAGFFEMKTICLRQNQQGQITVLLTGSPEASSLAMGWLRRFPAIDTIMQRHGKGWQVISGRSYWHDTFGGKLFRFAPTSFAQVNPAQREVLLQTVRDLIGEIQGELWDIYCGVGTFGIALAGPETYLWGVEEDSLSIEMAKRNAETNGLEHFKFQAGRAEDLLPRRQTSPEAVLVDPPRTGCKEVVLQAIAKAQPKKLVYVSCHPGTLARDLKLLASLGYHAVTIRPVDMFPQTVHVETVVLLEAQV